MPKTDPQWRAPVVIAVLLSGCLLAACGSSNNSNGSTSTALAAAGGPASTASRSAFRTCLREHGVKLPAHPGGFRERNGSQGGPPGGPPSGGGFFFGSGGAGARFRNNPKMAGAFKACGGRAITRRRFTLSHAAVNKFVTCVRQHGYDLPKPNFSGHGPVFPANIRTNSKFQMASRTCARLLFPGPPGGPTTTNPTS